MLQYYRMPIARFLLVVALRRPAMWPCWSAVRACRTSTHSWLEGAVHRRAELQAFSVASPAEEAVRMTVTPRLGGVSLISVTSYPPPSVRCVTCDTRQPAAKRYRSMDRLRTSAEFVGLL